MPEFKVYIDQDLCTGDGICQEICPELFGAHDDGLYYVKEAFWDSIYGPDDEKEPVLKMGQGLAAVPLNLLDSCVEAAEDCPGACIFIEEV